MRGVDEVLPRDELLELLQTEQQLVIKLGFDPTAPHLHLGHSVILNKLKIFQDLGHKIVFIVGDFTASIGDPSGKSKTRPALTDEQVQHNAATYAEQIYKILDRDKIEVVNNSNWLAAKSAKDLIKLASGQTVARMLERDDFAKRYKDKQPISIHEFIYPILQGYDSVAISADVELGGRDQRFNLLMGRELQKKYGLKQQAVFMMPLLEGTDGVQKMSKSLHNTIDLVDSAEDMYGKIMSISDNLMWRYYELLSFAEDDDINTMREKVTSGYNPKYVKVALAKEIVTRFHTTAAAENAAESFEKRFKQGKLPDNIPEVEVVIASDGASLAYAMKQARLVESSSAGIRMLKQGAVKVNSEKVSENLLLQCSDKAYLIQVGKRKIANVTIASAI